MSIVDDLMRVYELIIAEPFPQALWFIDRDRQYHWLEATLPAIEPDPYRVCESTVFGMPVHRWRSHAIRKRMEELVQRDGWNIDRVRRVFPFCQPGIWVQMSDGKHQHIAIVDQLAQERE